MDNFKLMSLVFFHNTFDSSLQETDPHLDHGLGGDVGFDKHQHPGSLSLVYDLVATSTKGSLLKLQSKAIVLLDWRLLELEEFRLVVRYVVEQSIAGNEGRDILPANLPGSVSESPIVEELYREWERKYPRGSF